MTAGMCDEYQYDLIVMKVSGNGDHGPRKSCAKFGDRIPWDVDP